MSAIHPFEKALEEFELSAYYLGGKYVEIGMQHATKPELDELEEHKNKLRSLYYERYTEGFTAGEKSQAKFPRVEGS